MNTSTRSCPIDAAKRLLKYASLLEKLSRQGRDIVSAQHISTQTGVDVETLRDDLALADVVAHGTSNFSVAHLIRSIDALLGCGRTDDAVLVGTGMALEETKNRGLNVVATFDLNEPTNAMTADNIQIFHVKKLANLAERLQLRNGILAVPAESAQYITDMMVSSGITDIWNASGTEVQVPDSVTLHRLTACG